MNEGEREIKDACKVFCSLIMSTRNYVERSVSRDLEKGLGGRCRLTHAKSLGSQRGDLKENTGLDATLSSINNAYYV